MRTYFSFFILAVLAFSCGDAGISLNVSKELPVTVAFDVPIPSTPAELNDLLNVNPPSQSLNYDLNEVGAFSGNLDDISNQAGGSTIVFNRLSYQIDGVDAMESNIDMDELTMTITLGGVDIVVPAYSNQALQNIAKTEIALTPTELEQISSQLISNGSVGATIVFDLASVPNGLDLMDLDFTMHFDVTLKVRQSFF